MLSIFMDVDDTIYPTQNNNQISKTNLETLFKAKHNNVLLNIATGNAQWNKIQRISDQINAKFIITYSGAKIYDNEFKKTLKTWFIEKQDIEILIELSKKYSYATFAFYEEDNLVFYNKIHQYFIDNIKDAMIDENQQDIITNKINDMTKILLVEIAINETNAEVIYENLKQIFKNTKTIIKKIGDYYIEIKFANVSKGHAIQYLLDNNILNSTWEDIMTIGDSLNDLTMLEMSPYGYIMDNAPNQLKNKIALHTCDVKQNGLSFAINDFLYRKKN